MSRNSPRHHPHHASALGCHTLCSSSFTSSVNYHAYACRMRSSLFKPHLIRICLVLGTLLLSCSIDLCPHLLRPPFVQNRSIVLYPEHRVVPAPGLSLLLLSSILLPPVLLGCRCVQHHAHMVNRQSHVRPEPCEARARRARAKNCMRKAGNHEPTASQMVFVGTRFSIGLQMQPGKSSLTTGQHVECLHMYRSTRSPHKYNQLYFPSLTLTLCLSCHFFKSFD